MQYRLQAAELLFADEVAALSLATGYCLVCGRKLKVKASIDAGIGPVCAGRQRTREQTHSPTAEVLDDLVAWAAGR
jgi:hypothetical protein